MPGHAVQRVNHPAHSGDRALAVERALCPLLYGTMIFTEGWEISAASSSLVISEHYSFDILERNRIVQLEGACKDRLVQLQDLWI